MRTNFHIFTIPNRERVSEAETLFQQALTLDPTFGLAHYNFSQLLKHLKLHDKQIHHLTQALKYNPKVRPWSRGWSDQIIA